MKFKSIPLFFLLAITFGCHLTNQIENSLSEDKLKGNIASIIESKHTTYESSGQLIPDKLTDKRITHYNQNGNIISFAWYADREERLINKIIYKYNDDQKLIEEEWYNSKEKLEGKNYLAYKNAGTRVEKKYFDFKDSLTSVDVFKYNDQKQLIEETEYYPNGDIFVKEIFRYDEFGNMVARISDGEVSWVSGHSIFKYDSHGNRIMSKGYNPENNPRSNYQASAYNSTGDIILDSIFLFFPSEEEFHVIKYDYEYDQKQNWIRKNIDETVTSISRQDNEIDTTTYQKNKIVLREIVYY